MSGKEKKYLSDYPILLAEWDYQKNHGLDPQTIRHRSRTVVWWKCNKGHEWQATIAARSQGYGCPYCSGRYVIPGQTDLKTVNPILAKEWDYAMNDTLSPEDFSMGSNKKVWWKCNNGHQWQAIIKHRNNGSGCPVCARLNRKKIIN